MRPLKHLRIFNDDQTTTTTQSDPTSGRHRVGLNFSNISTRYDCSKIIQPSNNSQLDNQFLSSPSVISNQPLNELLFSPSPFPSEQICDHENSLFKILMTHSASTQPQSRLQDSTDRSLTRVDFLQNHRHSTSEPNSSLKPFGDTPIKKHNNEFQQVVDSLFGASKQPSNPREHSRSRQQTKRSPNCTSDIISVRGESRLVRSLRTSMAVLEKENCDLRLKLTEQTIRELRE